MGNATDGAEVEVGAAAPDPVLRDRREQPVRLSELWADGPLVALFLRHFG